MASIIKSEPTDDDDIWLYGGVRGGVSAEGKIYITPLHGTARLQSPARHRGGGVRNDSDQITH